MRFSVIVPIYNVARFIPDGLAQLDGQTFTGNWEILLVDDGSTDGSAAMIDAAAGRNPRVRVFHQQNAGSGSARNRGIDNARGEYICFFDIDDSVAPDWLSRLDRALSDAGNPDICIFGFDEMDIDSGNVAERSFTPMNLRSNRELRDIWALHLSGAHGGNNGFVWNKAYRRDFLNRHSLRFGNERIQQDEVFNLHLYRYVDTALIISDILYHYKIYPRGNTRSYFIPDRIEIYEAVISAFRNLMSEWDLSDSTVDKWLARRFLDNVIQTLTFNCYHPDAQWDRSERRRQMAAILSRPEVKSLPDRLRRLDACPSGFPLSSYIKAIETQSVDKVESTRRISMAIDTMKHCARRLLRR